LCGKIIGRKKKKKKILGMFLFDCSASMIGKKFDIAKSVAITVINTLTKQGNDPWTMKHALTASFVGKSLKSVDV
jgi:uncharacterized protein with von Willebrand factor type A (vWA) domain